jgi:curved DNA-binding protein
MEYKDYYQILGVARNADDKAIKRAFRKLAQQYHPDKNPGDKAAEAKFKEINEAYTVLSDPEKRGKYDRFGAQWEQYAAGGGQPEGFDWSGWSNMGGGGRGGTQYRTVTPEEFEQMFGGAGGAGGGFSSFFDALFGAGAGGRPTGGQYRTRGGPRYGFDFEPQAGRSVATEPEVPVDVTLDEAYRGSTRTLQTEGGRRLEVNIPRGVKTGSRVRVRGGVDGGDVYLRVKVLDDPRFTREGNDLRAKVPLDLYTALLGGEVQVPTMDGAVALKIPAGTQNGRTFRLRGLGTPDVKNPDQRGDLFAVMEVTLPTDLSAEERRLFEELRKLRRPAGAA